MKVSLTRASLDALAARIGNQKNADPSFGQLVRAVAAKAMTSMTPNAQADMAIFKSLSTGTTPGSYLVPEIQANEIVALLSRGSTLRKSGARLFPCGNVRKFDIPVETGAADVRYIGENTTQTAVDPSFEQRTHTTKDMRALFYASKSLARASAPVFDVVVRDLAARSVARAEDASFFAGMAGGPTSVANISGVNVILQAGASLAYADLMAVIQAAIDSEGPIEDFAFYANGSVLNKIWSLKDSNGRPILRPKRGDNGSAFELLGFPLYITPTIPNHIGSGSATSFLLFTFPENIQIADGQMELAVSEGFRFEFDQVAVRVVAPRDFSLGQPSAAILLENII